jgi:hypothetical protein
VRRAFAFIMPHARSLRLPVLEGGLALRAYALVLGMAAPAHQFDVANCSVVAEMPGDRKIVHSADGWIRHFYATAPSCKCSLVGSRPRTCGRGLRPHATK